jgi:hypothetical protein
MTDSLNAQVEFDECERKEKLQDVISHSVGGLGTLGALETLV